MSALSLALGFALWAVVAAWLYHKASEETGGPLGVTDAELRAAWRAAGPNASAREIAAAIIRARAK